MQVADKGENQYANTADQIQREAAIVRVDQRGAGAAKMPRWMISAIKALPEVQCLAVNQCEKAKHQETKYTKGGPRKNKSTFFLVNLCVLCPSLGRLRAGLVVKVLPCLST